jgi:hypothetical protein
VTPSWRTVPTFGASLGFNVNQIFGIEANYAMVLSTFDPNTTSLDATSKKAKEDKSIHQFGLNGVLHLADGPLVPYLTAGAGFVSVDETEFAHNIGVGAKYFVTDLIGVRLDFRGWFSPDAPAQDEYAPLRRDARRRLPVRRRQRHRRRRHPQTATTSAAASPRIATASRTTTVAPRRTTTKDGVADDADKCPMQAEDKDGDRDEDGCPDLELDATATASRIRRDKCPNEAEDKDGFEDEDGCPDPDNDKDGILDVDDQVPE